MRRSWLAIAVILTVPSGCDNVKWGGVQVHVEQPSGNVTSQGASRTGAGSTSAPGHVISPTGPILLAGTRKGDSATLAVVGAVDGDSLDAFPSDTASPGYRAYVTSRLLSPGARFVLFSEGVRVGGLTVSSTGLDHRYCVARPTVTGVVELIPKAAAATRLLALPESAASGRPYGMYQAMTDNYRQRVASLTLAVQEIRHVGATWPNSVLAARADIQAFQLQGAPTPSIAATFLYEDSLSTAAPEGVGAYALFLMASRQDTTYRTDFVWYRKAETSGKGAPQYFGHIDLSGDGRSEVLLDVFGNGIRWFALLGERNGRWGRTFEDPCGRSGSSAGS